MVDSKQKPASKARPAAKAASKAPVKAAKTSSGSVKAVTSAGSVKAATSSGSVKAATSSGSVKAATSSGSVKAVTSAGSVKAATSSGSVKAATSSGSVKAVAKKAAPKARASAEAKAAAPKASAPAKKPARPKAEAKPSATPSEAKPAAKKRAPKKAEAKPVLVPDAVYAPEQLTMAPLVEVVYVEEEISPPPASRPIEAPRYDYEAARTDPSSEVSVDGWAAKKLDAAQRSVLEAIRGVVRRVAPGAVERVKWSRPVWEQGGPFAYFMPGARQITFGFWRGSELPDPRGLLQGAGEKMRHMKLKLGEQLPLEAIERFVREAVKRNEKAGKKARAR